MRGPIPPIEHHAPPRPPAPPRIRRRARSAARASFDQLTRRQRLLVLLHHGDALNPVEIAEAVADGTTPGGIVRELNAALDQIHRDVKRRSADAAA